MGRVGWVLIATGGGVAGGGGGFLFSAGRAADELSANLPSPGDLPDRHFDAELQAMEDRYDLHRGLGGAGLVGGGALMGIGTLLVLIDGGP